MLRVWGIILLDDCLPVNFTPGFRTGGIFCARVELIMLYSCEDSGPSKLVLFGSGVVVLVVIIVAVSTIIYLGLMVMVS